MCTITKQQEKIDNFKINMYFFNSARESFEYILTKKLISKTILIPAYIGYSSREGSGIFDPIKNSKIKYKFYKFTPNLEIDTKYLYKQIDKNKNCVLLLVHYFGFQDKEIRKIKKYAKSKNVIVIEDCAHSFFSFFNNVHVDSDYYIFSLHKMLPYNKGGLLVSKKDLSIKTNTDYNPFEYNINKIAKKRIENYDYLLEKLLKLDNIKVLRKILKNDIPQTLPILIESEKIRDKLYFGLNKNNFGAVSLYHELIKDIKVNKFKNEFFISKHILNLPIHQDAGFNEIDKMFILLKKLL